MKIRTLDIRTFAIAAGLSVLATAAGAQEWKPTKPLKLITLTTAGGSLDILARLVAEEISKQLGSQMVVENRVGAGGNVGAQALAKSDPDGHTLGMVTVSTHGVNPTLFGAGLRFDPVKDFAPITLAAELKNVVVVHPSVPVKNVTELVAYARANPDKISFGSAGTGTTQHLSGELVKMITGVKMTHVPYRGAAAAVPDLLAGRIQLMFVSIPDVKSHIDAGTLRGIGVTSRARSPALPAMTPMAEQEGFKDFDVRGWFGVMAPGGTPRAAVDRYNQIITTFLKRPEVTKRLADIGLDTITSTPDEMGAFIKSEIAKWEPVVKASGAKVQ